MYRCCSGVRVPHTGTGIQHRVIHRDVKSSNILLDENWAAKISDFGVSKIGPANQSDTHVSTRVVGTFGYLDPDYAFTGSLTRKSDVYSFGVVLFEVLCARPALDRRLHEDHRGLAGWAQYCVKKGIVKQIIDPNLKSQIMPRSLLAFVKVADGCLHARPKERPTMTLVLADLERALNLQETAKVASGFTEKLGLLFSVTPRPISVHTAQACKDNKNDNSSSGNSTIPNKDGVDVLQVPPSGQIVTQKMKVFTFAELKNATKNFRADTLVGVGGSGKVFKGWVSEETYAPLKPGIGTLIAVKRLHPESVQGFKEWKVELLGRYTHPNLVKLLGYCMEDRDLLIVYEYMQRGSLENHIFRRRGGEPLPWATRLKIATGAARGLAFLHTAEKQVIYRNFKSSNILLDMEFNPKISNFGLAKLAPLEGTHVTTRIRGTWGYAAPEYVATGHLYVKSDVYSFGVVLLEMFTGMRVFDMNRSPGNHNLIDYATPLLRDKRMLSSLVDPRLDGDYPPEGAFQLAALALCCLEPSPQARPPMTEVVETLEQIQHLTDIRQKKSYR